MFHNTSTYQNTISDAITYYSNDSVVNDLKIATERRRLSFEIQINRVKRGEICHTIRREAISWGKMTTQIPRFR